MWLNEWPTDGDIIAAILQAMGYYGVIASSVLTSTNIHLVASAIISIWAGTHASLCRPASARSNRPDRRREKDQSHEGRGQNDEDQDSAAESRMEYLNLQDAFLMPVFAGLTLVGLFLLIRWLQDPTILSKIINWYFGIFGTIALTNFLSDFVLLVHDFIFPASWTTSNGQLWIVDANRRTARKYAPDEASDLSNNESMATSPLPKWLFPTMITFPRSWRSCLWTLREMPLLKLRLKAFCKGFLRADMLVFSTNIATAAVAIAIQAFSSLYKAPWFINNLSALAFVYSALQMVSPTTAPTATLILCALFFYDIYFVFYTPVMVTVATKLDIPAKLMFPRGQGMSMLGLGDLVIPGMVLGFALRFDLWLHYRKLQSHSSKSISAKTRSHDPHSKDKHADDQDLDKKIYVPATGYWGTRFWSSRRHIVRAGSKGAGAYFPKPYFHATLIGYFVGLMTTLLVMQASDHPQPALLYLVPGVLAAMWILAFQRGESQLLWQYSEDEKDEDSSASKTKHSPIENKAQGGSTSWWRKTFTSTEAQGAKQDKSSENDVHKNVAEKAGKNRLGDTTRSDVCSDSLAGCLLAISISLVPTCPPPVRFQQKEHSC